MRPSTKLSHPRRSGPFQDELINSQEFTTNYRVGTERSLNQVKLGVVLEKCCLAERQRWITKWRPAIILRKKESGQVMNGFGIYGRLVAWIKGDGIFVDESQRTTNDNLVEPSWFQPTRSHPVWIAIPAIERVESQAADSKLPHSTRRIITQER